MPALILPTSTFFAPKSSSSWLFDDFLFDTFKPATTTTCRNGSISTGTRSNHIYENDMAYEFSLDLPGIKAADITLQLEERGRVLHLSGERKTKSPTGSNSYKIDRRFTIRTDNIDKTKITSTLVDGVLTVTLPKIKININNRGETIDDSMSAPAPTSITIVEGEPCVLEDGYNVTVDVPGVKVDNIKLELDASKETLLLHADRRGHNGTKSRVTKQKFLLGDDLDTASVYAYLVDGVLTITAKKLKDEVTRIPVGTEIERELVVNSDINMNEETKEVSND
jgi:HSP20 family molecular chaperone IbpA